MNPYEEIDQHLTRAKVHATKEGKVDYDQQAEIDAAYAAYVLLWKRLETLQPGAYEKPVGGQDVR